MIRTVELRAKLPFEAKTFCDAAGMKLQHVKPHGAMYNMAAKDRKLADAICEAIREVDPKLILLDEPSMGLAPIIVDKIFDILQKIREMGTTVLLVEQNANMALSIADRAYVIETGLITKSGPAREMLGNDEIRKAYLGG